MAKGASEGDLSPGFIYLFGHRFFQNKILLNLAFNFFSITTKLFVISFFDTRYDQRVSGFILCENVPKISFLRPQANALLFFFAIARNFKDSSILTYFGGSHLHVGTAVAEWGKAQVLET